MPNPIAYAALFSFPLLALILARRLRLQEAIIWTILLGYLLLPTKPSIDFPIPGIPEINKNTVPALCILVMSLVAGRRLSPAAGERGAGGGRAGPGARPEARPDPGPDRQAAAAMPGVAARLTPQTGLPSAVSPDLPQGRGIPRVTRETAPPRTGAAPRAGARLQGAGVQGRSLLASRLVPVLLVISLFVSPLLTTLTNGEARFVGGGVYVQGMRLYDAGAMISGAFVTLLPFVLARRHLATPEAHRMLLRIFCIGGLAYTVPMMYEMRMSPQLNVDIYGYFPHSFAQHVRGGHYRPVVFLHHGLWLGIMIAGMVLAAAALWRARDGARPARWLWACLWLLLMLFLSRTLGAFGITLLLLPLVLLAGRRLQMMVIAALAIVILLYPALRGAGLIPVQTIYEAALNINVDRANSLNYRLVNEDALLALANEKPLGGWGMWGRNLVYDAGGQPISVTDGAWVILVGVGGWVGYIGTFGLLGLPLALLALRGRKTPVPLVTIGLGFMLIANLIDLIPNATLTPLTWLLAGAIAGFYERGMAEADPRAEEPSARYRPGRRLPGQGGARGSGLAGGLAGARARPAGPALRLGPAADDAAGQEARR